ncbi:MAG: SixA phosphatase family protein [Gammaproteobacteria bacterium]
MRLVLVRHGEAEPLRLTDSDRALTGRGHEQAKATGRWLASIAPSSCVLACSSYRRARETANNVLTVLPQAALHVIPHVTPEDGVQKASRSIEGVASGDMLVVVTHMPLVAALVGWLEHGVPREGRPFALAEARVFELEVWGPGMARQIDGFVPAV